MAELTAIQWATHTFNPWIGCTKVHAGCTSCYAEADMDHRRGRVAWGPSGTRSRTSDANWREPLKWNRKAECNCGASGLGPKQCEFCEGGCERPRVFCASLADVFEDWQGKIVDHQGNQLRRCGCSDDPQTRPITEPITCLRCGSTSRPLTMRDCRCDLLGIINQTPNLDWLLLTKRPENVCRMMAAATNNINHFNIWLGTSVSDQETAEQYVGELAKLRDLVPVLFVSYEPALGPVDWGSVRGFSKVDWLIMGGESGPNARDCSIEWIASSIEQCRAAGVAPFVKQLGKRSAEYLDRPSGPNGKGQESKWLQLKDKKGGDPSEWPEPLRVREMPAREAADAP